MKPRFAIPLMISLGCATGENALQDGEGVGLDAGGTAGGGASSIIPGTSGSATGGSGFSGGGEPTAGTFPVAGTFGNAGTAGSFGNAGTGGAGGLGGTGGAGGTGGGAAGKSAGGSAGTAAGGNSAGTGGTGVVVGPYCDNQTKAPLPYTVNDGFQPSGWQGDVAAITVPAATPDACAMRAAGSVGACSAWRFTPNAATPAWAGVSWSKMWDAQYTHLPVCLASGATKVTFQARGALGGEQITFSAAGAAELPFTLTNAWQEYSISLAGVQYNTTDDGVDSGFFWKVAPPTPGGAPVTFFVDDLQFVQ